MNRKKYLLLNDIGAYKIAFGLSNYVWNVVLKWDHFAKDTVGKQFVRAADSIAANIAEGFGRFTKKDKVNFYRIGYSSIKEALDWNEKSKARNLLTTVQYVHILQELKRLPRELYSLIEFTNERLTR